MLEPVAKACRAGNSDISQQKMNSEAHVSTLITNLLTIRLRTTLTSAARNRMVFIMLRSSSKLIIVKIIYKKSKTDIAE